MTKFPRRNTYPRLKITDRRLRNHQVLRQYLRFQMRQGTSSAGSLEADESSDARVSKRGRERDRVADDLARRPWAHCRLGVHTYGLGLEIRVHHPVRVGISAGGGTKHEKDARLEARYAPLGVGVEELAAGAEEDGLGARLAIALRLLAVRLERELADVHLRRGLAVQRQPVEHRYNITWGIMGSALNEDRIGG